MSEDSVYSPLGTDISTGEIVTGAVTTAKIADAAVTTAKIADGAVTTAKLTVSHLWQLVEEITTTAAATDITFSSLDLESDKTYFLVIRGIANADSTNGNHISIFVNGDTTATHYHEITMYANGTDVGTSGADDAIIYYLGGGAKGAGFFKITKIAGEYPRGIVITYRDDTAKILNHNSWVHYDTTNVTSLTIHSALTAGFSAGAVLTLYKG